MTSNNKNLRTEKSENSDLPVSLCNDGFKPVSLSSFQEQKKENDVNVPNCFYNLSCLKSHKVKCTIRETNDVYRTCKEGFTPIKQKKKKGANCRRFFSCTQPQLHCAYKIFFENMYSFKLFICQVGDLKPK